MNIGVIGAGIIGLTTIEMLNKQFPNASVTLVANQFSPNTTSDGAAGIFRPSPSFSGPDPQLTLKWIENSFSFWKEYESKSEAIRPVSGYIFSKSNKEITKNHFLEKVLHTYREVSADELEKFSSCNFKYGSFFETILIDSKSFLAWVMERFVRSGGKMITKNLNTFGDLESFNFDVIFNCSGFGSKKLCSDRKLVPIRGQVFKIDNSHLEIRKFLYADYDTYIIPGSQNQVTLGGCRHYESYSKEWNEYDGDSIWDRCVTLEPRLERRYIVQKWTGLRPHRDVVRVERDSQHSLSQKIHLIHNYGHGGYGITAAPGTVRHAIQLFRESHRAKI